MENFALIALVEELRLAAVGMPVRRLVQYPGHVFSLETRSGRMPGLKLSLDPRNPCLWVPGRQPAVETTTDDFVMVLRKHLVPARLVAIEKPLSERILELHFTTALPAEELRQVILVAELFPNAPNLLLLDRSRRVLAAAVPPPPQRGIAQYDDYRYPELRRIPLDALLGEDIAWFDPDAFRADPRAWLVARVAGMGPVLAAEIASRVPGWPATTEGAAGEIRKIVRQLLEPATTTWVYTASPLSVILEHGDPEGLRNAVVSPIELVSLRGTRSAQTYPGMLAAMRAIADPLVSLNLLERTRSPELRRLRRELRKLQLTRERLLERQRSFEEAPALQATARLLAASGAGMDRHHTAVTVTEYTEAGPQVRSIPLDATRSLRENIARMFRAQQKAGRGLRMVRQQLSEITAAEARLREKERRLRAATHWEGWLAITKDARVRTRREPRAPSPVPRRRRPIRIDGCEVLVGRNSRENDELTFRVAAADDFWLHVADYAGSHVIVRNPSGAGELNAPVLLRAAELAAYHSQARNSAKVDVHYTQRKYVSKPRKAGPGLVRLRQFSTITVEPRDWAREEMTADAREEPAEEVGG